MPLGASRAGLMSVAADAIPDSVERPADNDTFSEEGYFGLKIESDAEFSTVTAEYSQGTDFASISRNVFILDANAEELDSKDVIWTNDEKVSFSGSFETGEYYILIGGGITSWGRYTTPSFPYESKVISITAGATGDRDGDGGLDTDSVASVTDEIYNFDKIIIE